MHRRKRDGTTMLPRKCTAPGGVVIVSLETGEAFATITKPTAHRKLRTTPGQTLQQKSSHHITKLPASKDADCTTPRRPPPCETSCGRAAAAWHPNRRRKHTRSIALHSRLTTHRGLAASAAGLHTLTGASPHPSLATTPICFSDCCQKEEQGRPAPCTPHSRSAARTPNHHKCSNLKVTQAWPQTSKPPAPSSNDVLHWISHC